MDTADLGGTDGWGPVVRPSEVEPEPPFPHPWEGRAFALTVLTMGRISGRNLDAFRYALSRLDRASYLDDGYYGRWLNAAELMLTDSAILAPGAVEARARARRGEDVSEPAAPEPARPDYAPTAPGSLREIGSPPRFAPGDPVRPLAEAPAPAAKLPRYVRGRAGVVTAVRPPHVLPDTHAVLAGEHPQHVYTVAFTARELWGDGAEDATVHADLSESHLEPR
ncbi:MULTISPECIES: SH3-like domain-containing protein [unclassified Pseudonocardia]|uniref:SH3-like domain-containing protein n=1 Tax=unclassified Pseudonocardia TaxID=2619320 RepID=UPI0001FFE15C|nr:SH3-like domain-containing protein [Pseudonocardia sp. Ae707_Ps1]OLM19624.1 Cobalt-containing nitrile hydratase subunit beta [Pseudonocardia sp. Ae707_Ps1]